MPVSYLPCLTPVLLIGIPLLLLRVGLRAAITGGILSVLLVAAFLLSIYVPGWRLHSQAAAGHAAAQYQYAQWLENHSWDVQQVLPLFGKADVDGGFAWLQKAAAQDYPPAVWLVGVRLKYGIFVPKPPNWTGPGSGNVWPQPAGQALIDHAANDLHYTNPADGPQFYWQHYRKGLPP